MFVYLTLVVLIRVLFILPVLSIQYTEALHQIIVPNFLTQHLSFNKQKHQLESKDLNLYSNLAMDELLLLLLPLTKNL